MDAVDTLGSSGVHPEQVPRFSKQHAPEPESASPAVLLELGDASSCCQPAVAGAAPVEHVGVLGSLPSDFAGACHCWRCSPWLVLPRHPCAYGRGLLRLSLLPPLPRYLVRRRRLEMPTAGAALLGCSSPATTVARYADAVNC